MKTHHYQPALRKRRAFDHAEVRFYAVNSYAVRDATRVDEEFGNFGTHAEFPDLVPDGEVWISEKLVPREGPFFLANALTRFRQTAAGRSEEPAYQAGIDVERVLRERINGVEFRDGKPHRKVPEAIYLKQYLTLNDPQGPVEVWLVDGNLVRSYYKTDYTQGGHAYVYPWIPRGQIWVETGVDRREVPFVICHEYTERRLMRDARLDYDTAHPICSRMEYDLRKTRGATPLLTGGHRKLGRKALPAVADPAVFDFVLRTYVHGQTG
ncbi:MAG: hypothetical protein U0736_09600 [Gemmataceae bacterium]